MVGQDKGLHRRVHMLAPAASAKNAVVAGAHRLVVFFFGLRHAAAHVQRGAGLASTGDIVEFTFNRQHRRGGDVAWAHALQLAGDRFHVPRAFDQ